MHFSPSGIINCEFLFLTIQIKRYWEREKENQNYIDLYDKCFKGNKDDNIEKAVKMQYEYSKEPNVFIGSILGYIKYSEWLNVDKNQLYYLETHNNKNQLYYLETHNKSSDDINRGKAQDLIIL